MCFLLSFAAAMPIEAEEIQVTNRSYSAVIDHFEMCHNAVYCRIELSCFKILMLRVVATFVKLVAANDAKYRVKLSSLS